ncbi:hypothetical protein XENOCAPTIV_021333 [Xenoophorus captivus]|uniref:Uncharacterized protein n=1 Tax=Xenoophorus captivus TaxID=1517983 RepID=A0ABV0SJB4_9TELE
MVRQDRFMRKYCYFFTLNAICQHKVQRIKTKCAGVHSVIRASNFSMLFFSNLSGVLTVFYELHFLTTLDWQPVQGVNCLLPAPPRPFTDKQVKTMVCWKDG